MGILLLSAKTGLQLPPGLNALYDLAAGSGQLVKDYSGLENDGVRGSTAGPDANDPAWSTDGLILDGDQYVEYTLDASLQPTEWTICAAIRQTADTPNPLVGWGGTTFPAVYMAAPFNSFRPLIWLSNGCFRYFESSSPVNIQDAQWHFLVYRCPGNTAAAINSSSLWVDGVEQTVNSTNATADGISKSAFRLGTAGLVHLARADLAFFSLHGRVLDDSEIETMHKYAKSVLSGRVSLP